MNISIMFPGFRFAHPGYFPNGVASVEHGLDDYWVDPTSKALTSKYFGSTPDGKILWRTTATGIPSKVMPVPGFYDGTVTHSSNYYDTHGNLIASYGTDPSNPDEYSITLNYMQHVSNSFGSQFKAPWGSTGNSIN